MLGSEWFWYFVCANDFEEMLVINAIYFPEMSQIGRNLMYIYSFGLVKISESELLLSLGHGY